MRERTEDAPTIVQPDPRLVKGGHINLFSDLEDVGIDSYRSSVALLTLDCLQNERSLQDAISQASKKKDDRKKGQDDDAETDKGFRLAPSQADRTPWYTKQKDDATPTLDERRRYAISALAISTCVSTIVLLVDPATRVIKPATTPSPLLKPHLRAPKLPPLPPLLSLPPSPNTLHSVNPTR